MGIFGKNEAEKTNEKAKTFYVFVAQAGNGKQSSLSSAITSMYGNLYGSGDIDTEAQKLKNRYESDTDLELIVVKHKEWSPSISAKSVGGGMSSVNFNVKANMRAAEKYLKKAGYSKAAIAAAIQISTDKNLNDSDMVAGNFFIGVPI